MIYTIYGQLGRVVKLLEESQQKKNKTPRIKLPGLTLYHFWGSYFSRVTRDAIYKMGVEIPFKDTLLDHQAYEELLKQGGQDLVPCLRIETSDGVKWMYESQDIINYLKSKAK